MAEKIAARIVSIVFHPLLMTSLGLLILFFSGTSLAVVQPDIKRISLTVVLLFSGVFPGAMIILLYLTRTISDIELRYRQERILPVSLAAIMLLFTFFVMRKIPQLMPGHMGFLIAPAAGLLVVLMLNRRMNTSIHMLGLGSIIALMVILAVFFGAQIQALFILAVLASGLTATARVLLGHHTMKEVTAGFFAGFLVTCSSMIVFIL
jgi:hypothetical protein